MVDGPTPSEAWRALVKATQARLAATPATLGIATRLERKARSAFVGALLKHAARFT